MSKDRVRMTLDLSQGVNARIEDICKRRGLTKADALRAAFELLLAAKRAENDGFTVGAWADRTTPCCGTPIRIEREFVGF